MNMIHTHQLTWKCAKPLSKRKVVFLQGFVHFHVSRWGGYMLFCFIFFLSQAHMRCWRMFRVQALALLASIPFLRM